MVELSTIVMGVEVVIITMVLVGAYFGRRLNMNYHHYLVYLAMIIQFFVLTIWMLPNFVFIVSDSGLGLLLGFHMLSGVITFLGAAYLAVEFLREDNDYDLKKLRRTRPIMIMVTITWVISFLLGTLLYLSSVVFG